ncbi:MAG: acetyl-CoA carboxylase biotin carboxyl carrier protein [bacterium]
MDLKRINRLITIMEEENLAELEIEDEDFKVKIAKPQAGSIIESKSSTHKSKVLSTKKIPIKKFEGKEVFKLTSPMVGFFYLSQTPRSPHYVNVGDKVLPTQIVCAIEVMGVVNEIEAKVAGKIKKILVEDGQPVEYGQPLFLIEPEEKEK